MNHITVSAPRVFAACADVHQTFLDTDKCAIDLNCRHCASPFSVRLRDWTIEPHSALVLNTIRVAQPSSRKGELGLIDGAAISEEDCKQFFDQWRFWPVCKSCPTPQTFSSILIRH